MSISNIKLIIFDLDGTLIDTDELIICSYRAVFEKYLPSYKLTREEELSFLGPPLKVMFEKYFTEDFSTLLKTYRDFSEKNTLNLAKVYPYARELLVSLKSKGYKLCVVTSRFKRSALEMLDVFSLTSFFDEIIGLDDVSIPKPNPEGVLKIMNQFHLKCQEVLFIGDALTDFEAGRNAGVMTGLVSWRKGNEKIDSNIKIDSYESLERLFR